VRGRQSLRGFRGEGALVTGDEHGTRHDGERSCDGCRGSEPISANEFADAVD
jgi:hypothetical protein